MKTSLLCLLLLACAPLVRAQEQPKDGAFHDPFADDTASAEKPAAPPVSDPLERVNRVFFHFNDTLYRWVLRPTAKGYEAVTPKPVRQSVDRFFVNLKFPVRGVNNLMEGRISGFGIETARFVVNTTVGIGGLFDPASHWKLNAQPADLDQTLAVYRIPTGCYLNLPVLGPSSPRGAVGSVGDMFLNPAFYVEPDWIGYTAKGVDMVNGTSLHYQEYDTLTAGTLDPYVAMRSAYMENRRATVKPK